MRESPKYIQTAFDNNFAIFDGETRTIVLSNLVPFLPNYIVTRELLDEIFKIDGPLDLSYSLGRVAARIPKCMWEYVLKTLNELMQQKRRLDYDFGRVTAIKAIATHIPADYMELSLSLLDNIEDLDNRQNAKKALLPGKDEDDRSLSTLIPKNPAALVSMIRAEYEFRKDTGYIGLREKLLQLFLDLDDSLVGDIMDIALQVFTVKDWLKAFRSSQDKLSPKSKKRILDLIIDKIRNGNTEEDWDEKQHMVPDPMIDFDEDETVNISEQPDSGFETSNNSLDFDFDEDEYGYSFEYRRRKNEKGELLSSVLFYLSEQDRQNIANEALDEITHSSTPRVSLLFRVLPFLEEEKKITILQKIITEAKRVGYDNNRQLLKRIIPFLKNIDKHAQMNLLLLLNAESTDDLIYRVISEGEKYGRDQIPLNLFPLLSNREEAIKEILKLNEMNQMDAFAILIPCLSEEDFPKIIKIALEWHWFPVRETIIRNITPRLSETLLSQIWLEIVSQPLEFPDSKIIPGLESESESRTKLLSEIAPYLTECKFEFLVANFERVLDILSRRSRKELMQNLAALAPVINKLGGEKAIQTLFDSIQDVGNWWK